MEVVYEDNHLIIIRKEAGEIVQGDKTGDTPLSETVKAWIKEKYAKTGNVFLGVVHRLDRPVSGLVVFAKTSKALTRMNEMFREGKVEKTYWAITRGTPSAPEGRLIHHIRSDGNKNKSFAFLHPVKDSKEAVLSYRVIARGERYNLLEINLETGRKHQIRVQLSAIGCPIKGDLKYGDKRSNTDGSISLMARRIRFIHPVSGKLIDVVAEPPADRLWHELSAGAGY